MSSRNSVRDGLPPSSVTSDSQGSGLSLMQHLIDEMERSSQRIEQFSNDQYVDRNVDHRQFELLYDDAWKSEESDAASLHEVPLDYLSKGNEDSGCEDAVTSAIAEVSKDFLSGIRAGSAPNQNGDSDESRISSDTEFKLLTGMASYARYPETAAGLSDNDWNPYGTESDTNMSPRVSSHDGSGPRSSDATRLSTLTSFNPPLHSSDLNINTPSTVMYSIPDTGTRRGNIQQQTEKDAAIYLKPDITADFSTISHISEQTLSPQKLVQDPIRTSDLNKTMRGSELETKNGERAQEQISGTKKPVADEDDKQMTASRSSTGYSSSASGVRVFENQWKENEAQLGSIHNATPKERARLLGIPEDLLDGLGFKGIDALNVSREEKADNSRDVMSRKYNPISGDGDLSDEDCLGKRVRKVLYDTQYLANTDGNKSSRTNTVIDYKMMQQDLQEIQDSLHHVIGPQSRLDTDSQLLGKTPVVSEDECEIIPSTTTTPERRKNKMAWDFAADIGYQQPAGLMGDISLDTLVTNPQRPSDERKSYNSDGDDTRTSGSSDKLEDHAAADQAMAEMSEILHPTTNGLHSSRDVDQMLSTFRDQRRQLESRYQQLNNQGLAEKVYRILTNQDPESQANGILSQTSAEERELKARYALSLHNKNFNFSVNSPSNDDSYNSLALPDDVRKRLDLSGLSSTEASKLADKSSLNLPPTSKGFTAFEDMTKFLSSQMAKVAERTFNHSLEMRVPPQTIQCYPLFADKESQEKKDARFTEDKTQSSSAETHEPQALRTTSFDAQNDRPASTSSPIETRAEERRDQGNNSPPSADDSDTSSEKRREKYRPYRPAGSKEVYYTESDAASVADSVTTVESTHMGSDDARGPLLPSSVLGSRKDPPNVVGIYGNRKPLSALQEGQSLPSIQEKSGIEEHEAENIQSGKGGRDSDIGRSGRNGYSASSDTADREGNAAGQSSATSWTRGDKNVGTSSSQAQDEGISMNVHADFSATGCDMPASHSVSAARRNARWANRTSEGQSKIPERSNNTNENAETWSTRRSDLNNRENLSQQARRRDFDSDFGWDRNRKSHDSYSLPTDAFIRSDNTVSSRAEDAREREPLSLRIQMTYDHDDDRPNLESQRYSYDREFDRDKLKAYSREDEFIPSLTRSTDHSEERAYRERFHDREKSSSPERDWPDYQALRGRALPRSYSDEDLYSPVRDARLSPAFHRALSPELRQAIEKRSPLLSRRIERSLAQPPAEYSDHHQRARNKDLARSLSPPPTFLARDHGRSSREDGQSPLSRRQPSLSPARRTNSWSPPLQRRAVSPSHLQRNDFQQSSQAGSPAERLTATSSERANRGKLDSWEKKRTPSPKRQVEMTLENMSSESDDTERDREPVSRRAQLLTQALTQDREPDIRPDINTLWEQFKAVNESYDSSMNSARMEAVADLLRNPSRHLIAQYLKEREEYRIERQERAEVEREKKLEEQKLQQKLRHSHFSSSEEELSGSYAEILAQKEEERMKRRISRKKKGRNADTKRPAPGEEEQKDPENVPDSLFSIPEDPSFEQSPSKATSSPSKLQKPNKYRQPHIIDPNMNKLRERIAKQRTKIDKNTLKELQRVEKLKRLEQLLSAKKQGQVSDETLERQLDEISSTSTPVSDNSQDGRDKNVSAYNATPLSDDSTTAKDSSAEMHAWKAEKERRIKEMKAVEMEKGRKPKPVKATKNRNNGHVGYRAQSAQSEVLGHQVRLLKLVKEGYLTPEEAYRLALERITGGDELSSMEESLRSSSDEFNGVHAGRLHRLYSPYARSDDFHNFRSYHAPKLKNTSSISEVDEGRYPSAFCRQDTEQFTPSQVAQPTSSNSQKFDAFGQRHQGPEAARPAHLKFRSPSTRERPASSVPSSSGPGQRGRLVPRRISPAPRLGSPVSHHSSPVSHTKWISPNRHITSTQQHGNSPSRSRVARNRPHSYSPPRKGSRSEHKHAHRHGKRGGSSCREKHYRSENDPPHQQEILDRGVAWHIPLDLHPSQWKEPKIRSQQKLPLQERKVVSNMQNSRTSSQPPVSFTQPEGVEPLQGWQARGDNEGIWCKSDHPQGIPHELWEHIVQHDALATKTNHYEVDPLMDRVQYILNKPSGDSGTDEGRDKEKDGTWDKKSTLKMSLQEAFLAHKQSFISKCRERQKRLALSRENRHLQECLRLEREAIFMDQERQAPPNINAHPYSDNLYQPKRRFFTKTEMKEMTMKRYKKLPEVIMKKESDKRKAECKLNRLRARIFNKKVQRDVLRKSSTRQC